MECCWHLQNGKSWLLLFLAQRTRGILSYSVLVTIVSSPPSCLTAWAIFLSAFSFSLHFWYYLLAENLTHPLSQGCCVSFLSRDNSHPPHNTSSGLNTEERCTDNTANASSSPHGIHATTSAIVSSNPTTLATCSASHVARPTTRRPMPVTNNFPLSEHFNAPIRPHIWYSKRRAWTRAQLDRERREFFETRVTGRQEVWAALAAAITLMRECDLATAQSIVDAAGITVPTGDLCQGCYDEQGALYRLPQCIVNDPENMIRTDATGDYSGEDDDDDLSVVDDDDDASGDELISNDLEQRRDEKGKTSERDLISVKARLSDRGGLDLVVSVGKNRSVGFIARKIQEEAEVCSTFSSPVSGSGN